MTPSGRTRRRPGKGRGREAAPAGPGPESALTHWKGEPVEVLRRLWGIPLLEVHGSLSSTNDRARALAATGAPAFSVVLAEAQTEGRGRAGRPWFSPSGSGLWLSLLLPAPRGRAEEGNVRVLPLVAGLAVCRAVEALVPGARARVKWPNDVLLQERKAAGILCEREYAGTEPLPVVVGIGVNVRPFSEGAPATVRARAIALDEVAGRAVSRSRLAGVLLSACRELLGGRLAELTPTLREELEGRDALRGRRVRMDDGSRGLVRGIDPSGALRLEEESGGTRRISSGTVEWIEAVGKGTGGGEERTG